MNRRRSCSVARCPGAIRAGTACCSLLLMSDLSKGQRMLRRLIGADGGAQDALLGQTQAETGSYYLFRHLPMVDSNYRPQHAYPRRIPCPIPKRSSTPRPFASKST